MKTEDLFYGKTKRQFMKSLGVAEDSLEGRTVEALLRGMATAANRIESAAYWIQSKMDGVDRQFSKMAETGDLTGACLNDLGELQSQGMAYDAAVAAYAALSEQLEILVGRIKDSQEA